MNRTASIEGPSEEPERDSISIEVAVGEFALSALRAGLEAPDVSIAIAASLRFYLGAGEARPPGWSYPRFGGVGAAKPVELQISVEPALWRRFSSEAMSQGVSPNDLIGHAIMFYVADLDSRGEPAI